MLHEMFDIGGSRGDDVERRFKQYFEDTTMAIIKAVPNRIPSTIGRTGAANEASGLAEKLGGVGEVPVDIAEGILAIAQTWGMAPVDVVKSTSKHFRRWIK